MFRVRATSFLAGFAVASAIAIYQLQKDVWGSHQILADEVEGYYSQLEKRIKQLEHLTGLSPSKDTHQVAGKDD
ncbi:hypothetical protein BDL97_02G101500 [Sphagnum fallax]|jgi:hypothetical protein|uniref:Uncharacterized protein n=2 Tax=Sphagnum jensenii TaxID=128206 RepID=A0ABP1B843_9BRYO|nr:hypothetical protein BDL97_02G101500 [Sphagnum fallax]